MARNNRIHNHIKKYLKAQKGKCYYCEQDVFVRRDVTDVYYKRNKSRLATFDHIITNAAGGTYAFTNGVCACSRCNTLRGDMLFEKFKEKALILIEMHKAKMIRRSQQMGKKKLAFLKNSYILARFAIQAGKTVEQTFEQYVEEY